MTENDANSMTVNELITHAETYHYDNPLIVALAAWAESADDDMRIAEYTTSEREKEADEAIEARIEAEALVSELMEENEKLCLKIEAMEDI